MPFALAIIGVFLVVAAARGIGNVKLLGSLLVGDFTGQNNFLVWIFAIGLIGVVGYVPGLEKISRAFLILLFVIVMLKTKGGFLAQIQSAFQNGGTSANAQTGFSGTSAALNGLGGTAPAATGSTGATAP